MVASSTILSCNSSLPPLKTQNSLSKSSISPPKSQLSFLTGSDCNSKLTKTPRLILKPVKLRRLHRRSSFDTQSSQDPSLVSASPDENELLDDGETGGDGGGEEERDWTTSFLLFAFWAGLMYYVCVLSPNQTPVTDSYFVKKLLNLSGDDGFEMIEMNQVLVAEWYIMGLWPLVYAMLLIPTARSSKSTIPVWPFVVLSCFGGAYALIPYFVLWKPPTPPVEESELKRWPLNFLESKVTAGITLAAGLAIMVYAFSSCGDAWKEFYQYFKGSIHPYHEHRFLAALDTRSFLGLQRHDCSKMGWQRLLASSRVPNTTLRPFPLPSPTALVVRCSRGTDSIFRRNMINGVSSLQCAS